MKKLILVLLMMSLGCLALGSQSVEGVDGSSESVSYLTAEGKGNWRVVVIEDKN